MNVDLIDKANSWAIVWNTWKDNLDFVDFCNEKEGIYSDVRLLNMWFAEHIQTLKREIANLKEEVYGLKTQHH